MKIIMYKSTNCGACQMLEREIPRLEALAGNKIEIINLSIFPERKLENMKSVPATVLFKEDGSYKSFEGYAPADIIFNELLK